jgi:apolipoprotein N-acyltransferase
MPASKPARSEGDDRGAHRLVEQRTIFILLAAFAHVVLMTLAYPAVYFWPAALLAIVPLVWIAGGLERAHRHLLANGASRRQISRCSVRTLLLVTLGVMPLYIYQLHWLIPVTAVGYVPMAFGMALFAAGFVVLTAEIRGRLPRLPMALVVGMVWAALEVFRGELAFSGYAWFLIAHPLIDAPILPLPAAVLGTYFVSFLVAVLAGSLGDLWFGQAGQRRAGVASLAAVLLAWGGALLAPRGGSEGDPLLRVAMIQTNIPQDNKVAWTPEQKLRDFERFMELTEAAATQDPRPDVIIWPESMFPGALDPQAVAEQRDVGLIYMLDPRIVGRSRMLATEYHDRLLDLHRETGVAMLIGVIGLDNLRLNIDPEGRIRPSVDRQFNSVMLLTGGEVHPVRYDKLRLTPFGEVMPYISQWPWLERQLMAIGARGMRFDLSPGSEARTFELTAADGTLVAAATPICFEVTKPRLNHLLLGTVPPERPRFLVNATNDGWFGAFEGGRRQHLQISRWRSLENGIPMVRAANTGISAWIDGQGRVVKAGPDQGPASQSDGVLTAYLRPAVGGTIYSRVGDVFAWMALAGGCGFVLVALVRPRQAPA